MTRSALVALLAVAAGACSTRNPLGPSGGGGAAGTTGAAGAAGASALPFTQTANRNVDVLFMVDDSLGMSIEQERLISAFSSYTDTLKGLQGGLPNLHLGVVSSSMGAGRNPSLDHCPTGGDQGILHTKPLGPTCSQAILAPGQSFIINDAGQANYTGDLADMFSCIALLGDGGCGFEHQFESVLRALGADGAAAPAQNANFLRPDAFLQIVLLTDEDDCSAPPDSDLFDSSSSMVSDPLGPLQSYRCNEFGHLCGGKPPPRMPPGEEDLGMCVSAEDGRLLRVADVVNALKHLKADPSKVFVAAISGPPAPYKVNVGPPEIKSDPSPWPYVEHSCLTDQANGGEVFADPGVRIKQWVGGFGDNGVFASICDDLGPALKTIASQIGRALTPCLPANWSACSFVDHSLDSNGAPSSAPLPECRDAADSGPCWIATNDPVCPSGHAVLFTRPSPPAPSLSTTATCPM